jgi:hypothetical protein
MPRYRELAEELREEILRGAYSAETFPTESDLCKRYSVSRFTVREALRTLQGEGLIARKRGSGTIIQPAAVKFSNTRVIPAHILPKLARGRCQRRLLSNWGWLPVAAGRAFKGFALVVDRPSRLRQLMPMFTKVCAMLRCAFRPMKRRFFASLKNWAG